jgi:hypothetical protein
MLLGTECPVVGEEPKAHKMWLVIIRNVRTVIMTSNEDIFIPELGFDNI